MLFQSRAKRKLADSSDSANTESPTYIGKSARVEGVLRGDQPMWIEGEVHGEIDCASMVTIGQSARLKATVQAKSLVISGVVEGDVTGLERLEILKEGNVIGNVTYPPGNFKIHEGAIIQGQCLTLQQAAQLKMALLPPPLTAPPEDILEDELPTPSSSATESP